MGGSGVAFQVWPAGRGCIAHQALAMTRNVQAEQHAASAGRLTCATAADLALAAFLAGCCLALPARRLAFLAVAAAGGVLHQQLQAAAAGWQSIACDGRAHTRWCMGQTEVSTHLVSVPRNGGGTRRRPARLLAARLRAGGGRRALILHAGIVLPTLLPLRRAGRRPLRLGGARLAACASLAHGRPPIGALWLVIALPPRRGCSSSAGRVVAGACAGWPARGCGRCCGF